MSYEEIFIVGWFANAIMLIINVLVVLFVVKTNDSEVLKKQSQDLQKLKNEYDKYYPYHKQMSILAYFLPFTGFFRISYRLFEMYLFLSKNKETNIYHFVAYKYTCDIQKAKDSL